MSTANPSRFLAPIAVPAEVPQALDPNVREVLGLNFLSFLRAGGSFSWEDWAAMTAEMCELAEEAGRQVAGEKMHAQAVYFAREIVGQVGKSAGPLEGNLVRAELERAAAEAAAKVAAG